MKNIHKIITLFLVATFPVAIFYFYTWNSQKGEPGVPAVSRAVKSEIEKQIPEDFIKQAVEAKIKEISDIDVKIFTAHGEVLKYKTERDLVIKDLEALQKKIKPIIGQAQNDR